MVKLVEARLYLCQQSNDDRSFGPPKLTNLLYFADTTAYIRRGRPITGNTYLHFPHGPHPQGWHLTVKRMEENGDLQIFRNDNLRHDNRCCQHYFMTPLREADLSLLEDQEVAVLDQQLETYRQQTAEGLQEMSRWETAWLVTEDGEPLDYALAAVAAAPLSFNEIKRCQEIAEMVAARKLQPEGEPKPSAAG